MSDDPQVATPVAEQRTDQDELTAALTAKVIEQLTAGAWSVIAVGSNRGIDAIVHDALSAYGRTRVIAIMAMRMKP